MAKGGITVNFSSHSVQFTDFADTEFPRTYLAQANLEFSQIGTAYASGPARRQRQMWSVSSYVDTTKWQAIESLYVAWDALRAQGNNLAYVEVVDNLIGTPRTHRAFFTEPPTLAKLTPGNNTDFITTFVLVEV